MKTKQSKSYKIKLTITPKKGGSIQKIVDIDSDLTENKVKDFVMLEWLNGYMKRCNKRHTGFDSVVIAKKVTKIKISAEIIN